MPRKKTLLGSKAISTHEDEVTGEIIKIITKKKIVSSS